MADQPDMSMPTAGAGAAPETAARTGTWSIGLAALGLTAVLGALAAGVASVSGEPRPPDLGGPILAPSATSAPAPAPTALPATPVPLGRPDQPPPRARVRSEGSRDAARGTAAPVAVRALPVTPEPAATPGQQLTAVATPDTAAGLPAPVPARTSAP